MDLVSGSDPVKNGLRWSREHASVLNRARPAQGRSTPHPIGAMRSEQRGGSEINGFDWLGQAGFGKMSGR